MPIAKTASLKEGHKYQLQVPPDWMRVDPGSQKWHLQDVTLAKLATNADFENEDSPCIHPECSVPCVRASKFSAWVTIEGFSTGFQNNVFRAKPEWLVPICDCPLTVVLATGCSNPKHH